MTLLDTLEALTEFQRAGKIRYIGVSNETAFGVMRYLHLADKHDLPRIVTIQNPYSLLNRSFEVGLAEVSQFEGVELLAYSCLAFGTLTGKYLNGAKPAGARNTLFSRFTRYSSEQSQKAVAAYVDIAKRHGLDPAQWRWPLCVGSRLSPAPCWGRRTRRSCRPTWKVCSLS
ncbi:Oxidoreductase [Klebsiella pneumoniae]|uniref:Oxidoreductase n=1 Tax=Klebsiella pneumoniae TaxID=573 RepID=A0A4P0YG98_KLEPN|nr:Oxidoreductase [Klebsiella pneumoniae]